MFRSRVSSNFYYLAAIFVLIFLFGLTRFSQPVRNIAEKILVIPIQQKVYDWQRSFRKDSDGCQLKNERQIAELKMKIASLSEENQAQKRLLSSPLPGSWQFLPAKVIEVRDEVVRIDLGRNDGVKEEMAAVVENNFLGKVVTVSEKISKIRLPSFLDEKFSVKVVSSDNIILGRGLLVGRGLGQMRVEQILSSEGVSKGNLVTTAVEGEDLLVGEIEEVFEKKGEVFKTAQVKRLYNPEELNTIFLVRGKL